MPLLEVSCRSAKLEEENQFSSRQCAAAAGVPAAFLLLTIDISSVVVLLTCTDMSTLPVEGKPERISIPQVPQRFAKANDKLKKLIRFD